MKKIISLLLSVLMIVSVFSFSFNAFAAQTEIYTDFNLTVGDTVEIPVYIKNGTDMLGFGFEVSYNSEALSPVAVTKSEVINNGSFDDSIGTDKYSNPFRVVWAGTSALNSDGTIFTIKFSVIGSAKTNVTIQAMPNDTYDSSYTKVEISELKVLIDKTCSHGYVESVVKKATCTEDGLRQFECSLCGNKYTETVPKIQHQPVTDAAVPATYIAEGKTEGSHCSVCGKVLTPQKTIAKLKVSPTVIKKTVAKKKSFKLSWKKIKGISGYQIQYSTSSNFSKPKKVFVKNSTTHAKTIKKLKANKTYYFRIRTYVKVNGKNVYSKWSSKKKIVTK